MLASRSRLGVLAAGGLTACAASFTERAHSLKLELDGASAKSLQSSLATALGTPPVARREPHAVYFGVNPKDASENRGGQPMSPPIELIDDLFWIRDDERKNEEVLGLLRAENEYTDCKTAHLAAFRQTLYDEMLSHIQEDDDEHPVPAADGYEYWGRTVKGKSFRQYLRRKIGAAAEEVQVRAPWHEAPCHQAPWVHAHAHEHVTCTSRLTAARPPRALRCTST